MVSSILGSQSVSTIRLNQKPAANTPEITKRENLFSANGLWVQSTDVPDRGVGRDGSREDAQRLRRPAITKGRMNSPLLVQEETCCEGLILHNTVLPPTFPSPLPPVFGSFAKGFLLTGSEGR